MIKNILLVGLGGGAGSVCRWLCQRWVTHNYLHAFPWGTFAVNILGCLLIGIFWGMSFKGFDNNESWKLFLMTGICGGFTTFSAVTLEGVDLLKQQRLFLFFTYTLSSVVVGLLATFAGMKLMRS